MIFADDIVLCGKDCEGVERLTEDWRRVIEERGLRVSCQKTEYMPFNKEASGDVRITP